MPARYVDNKIASGQAGSNGRINDISLSPNGRHFLTRKMGLVLFIRLPSKLVVRLD
jgi:hypothetical protein